MIPHVGLLDALPEKFIRGILPCDHATFSVFDWNQEETVIPLELEPADVVSTSATRNQAVFQVVSDRSRLGIDCVCAEICRITVEGSCFFFRSRVEQSLGIRRKGFPIRLDH